ncbi:tetratricopeptide repeat protein [Geoalkalibacter subterraneus]|jgi:TolA-binding protein|uniref:Lipoprotein n=1 Tax=Geoalkalibacter subterraneus TaxID=483547 RepID=A0A0B5FUI1_9BACT|nr:tetratricopeptide repeat protein [Geoalkalibacter subterraneus]AJF07266.1 hypothetical protein GSUB_12815 [Geoalkalibacter subterraneus]
MFKRTLAAAALFLLLAACGDSAAKLYETAQFEEMQRNTEHASKLYREILSRYPEAPEARLARERLEALEGK